jgi:uncharacterized protein YggU (UPF0235/DUF167 family)
MSEKDFYTLGDRSAFLRVKAKPRAHADGILGVRAGELLVSVRAPAEKGKATAEVIRVIARALDLPRERVVLKSGGSSPHKVFELPREAAAALKSLAETAISS